jgi:fucose permease
VRFSSKPVVLSGGVGLALILSLLSIVSSPIALGVALFAFGSSLGSLEVAMNLHAVDVERVSEKPLMSRFHALFSVGGFLGSGIVTALLSRHRTQFKRNSQLHYSCVTDCCGSSAHALESTEN